MKEELTTKMHSEFSVTEKTDTKHKCFCALSDMDLFSYSIEKAAVLYAVTTDDILSYQNEYLSSK